MALFESYERRINQILPVLNKYGINSVEECLEICKEKGFNPYEIAHPEIGFIDIVLINKEKYIEIEP